MTPETFAHYLETARRYGVTGARIVVEGASCEFTLSPPVARAESSDFKSVEEELQRIDKNVLYGSAGGG